MKAVYCVYYIVKPYGNPCKYSENTLHNLNTSIGSWLGDNILFGINNYKKYSAYLKKIDITS